MNKGIIAINKPQGWTSFDVVNKIKHMVKPLKVGHLGTLDPMATGVLLVTIGKATKLFDIMQAKQKSYVATFKFGEETDTLDSTGKILKTTSIIPKLEEIKKILPKFIGKISQVPPKYSAKSINGERAYDLARKGVEFEIKPKDVEIYDIQVLNFQDNVLEVKIICGSGTYIRSLGRDIAYELNSLANMLSLVRTDVGSINIENCLDIQALTKENVVANIQPLKKVLNYPILELNETDSFKILNGQTLSVELIDGVYLLTHENQEVALIKTINGKAKMFIYLG